MAAAKYTVRNAEGEFVTNYANLSEANSYWVTSVPGCSIDQFEGNGPAVLQVKNDEGATVGYIDCPKIA